MIARELGFNSGSSNNENDTYDTYDTYINSVMENDMTNEPKEYVITFFQNTFIVRGPKVVTFADIKTRPFLLKQSLKSQNKLKELKIMY